MKYQLASRMAGMKASAVREILKVTQRPEVISFAGGLPAPELFPVDEISKVAQEVCAEEGRKVLQYATTEGRPTLRQKIADRMNKIYNSDLKMENILITTGSQQNLDMAGKIFLNPGDVVLMEAPTYLAAINAFKAYECTFKEVPTDDKGMIPEARVTHRGTTGARQLRDNKMNALESGKPEMIVTAKDQLIAGVQDAFADKSQNEGKQKRPH